MNEPSRDLAGLPAAAESTMPRLGRFLLLSIGINRYEEWPPLQTATTGAVELASLLGRDYGFEQVRTLTDAEATREAIIAELARLVDEAGPDDSVLIYFAGHGHIDPRTQTGSWIPVDAVADRTGQAYGASATWLPNSVVKDHLKACRARHVLLISDSCFAGDLLRGHREAPAVIDDAYVRRSFQHRSRLALTAGGSQPVVDSGLPGHSVFTGFLLHALRENERAWYLPSELHVRIRSGVAENATQQPLLGRLQDTGGEVEGEFVFFRRGYASLDLALEENRRRLAEAVRLREVEEASRKAQQDEVRRKKAELAEKERQLAELRKQGAEPGNPAERSSGLDQILALLADIEARHQELQRREAELAEARRVEEARLTAERLERIEQARQRFEVERAKYEKVLASPFADADMKRIAWQLFHQGQGVSVRDPGKPGKLEWGGEEAREAIAQPEVIPPSPPPLLPKTAPPRPNPVSRVAAKGVVPPVLVTSAPPPPMTGGLRRLSLVDVRSGFAGRIGDVLTVGAGLEFCWIPAGKFLIGSPVDLGEADEQPQTDITISRPFWMGRVPVRQREWKSLTGGTPSHFKGDELPVECITWKECVEVCRHLTERLRDQLPEGHEIRLPREAEWEYACRAGTRTSWFFGEDEAGLTVHAWFSGNSDGRTHPVGLKKANPWGLHDVYGNVREWCVDVKGRYPGGSATDFVGTEGWAIFGLGSTHVVRGGGWHSAAWACRSACRDAFDSDTRRSSLGLRLVLAPTAQRRSTRGQAIPPVRQGQPVPDALG